MHVVVSDTSPITNLAAIGQLDLLRLVFGTIVIPTAVFVDLVQKGGSGNPGARETRTAPWIITRPVQHTARVQALLSPKLQAGEVEAIVLAQELRADLVLLDERYARDLATQLQQPYTGLLGVLLVAKARGVIPLVQPVLDALIAGPKFRVSPTLYIDILRRAGEAPRP